MICDCCRKLIESSERPVGRARPFAHHATTQSFISSIKAGCPICRAILSEIDNPQRLLSHPKMVSSTSCHFHEAASFYDLSFTWFSAGAPRRRRVVLQSYDAMKQYIPHNPVVAHRGWTSETLEVVKSWMHRCSTQHQKCQALNTWKTSNSGFQPKRLVDVGSASGTTWRLILREDTTIPPTSYATISHRWSKDQHFKLISSSLEAYTNDQPISQMLGVFRDTVEIAKSLGIRYLWIDCLCIIQDSQSDWETESLEMCKVYANATCNISLTGFEGSSTGFLDQTSQYACLPCRVKPKWAPWLSEGWYVLDPFFWWSQVTKAPLAKRGWVFQERFLAPCVIHFGPDQVLWECASLVACEAFPQGLPPLAQTPQHTNFKRMDYLFQHDPREGLPPKAKMEEEDILHQWCLIIEAYTRTSLTKPSDKLVALAGVAQLMSQSQDRDRSTIPATYAAGIFEQHLLLMLEWHTDGGMFTRREPDGVRPPQYRGPSWSWVSIDGRAFYDYLPQKINDQQMWSRTTSWGLYLSRVNRRLGEPDVPQYPIPYECLAWKPLVWNMRPHVNTASGSSFGQILSGTLKLTGLLILARNVIKKTSSNHPSSRPLMLYLDAPNNSKQLKPTVMMLPLRCLQLRSIYIDEPLFYWVTALLLEPVRAQAHTYQRCGMLSILSTKGVRDLGIEMIESPFHARYMEGMKLENIRII